MVVDALRSRRGVNIMVVVVVALSTCYAEGGCVGIMLLEEEVMRSCRLEEMVMTLP